MEYSRTEMMIAAAARMLEDNKTVFVGTGMPMIASMVAQKLYYPNLVIVFEAGGLGPLLPYLPVSVGESLTTYKGLMAASMDYIMSIAQLGYIDYGFLGAAQMDKYGNINTTVIGEWDAPKVRLPGSGGANDVGSLSWKTIIIMKQDRKRFVDKLDFITTPGYLEGRGSREKYGLPKDTGPYRVITQLGVYGFNKDDKRMKLIALYPDTRKEEIIENSSFEILIPDKLDVLEPPTSDELHIMKEVDPAGIVIGRK